MDEDGAVRENVNKKDVSQQVDFGAWLLAWDRYAMGARDELKGAFCVRMHVSCQLLRCSIKQVS